MKPNPLRHRRSRPVFWTSAWLVVFQLWIATGVPSIWGHLTPTLFPLGERTPGSTALKAQYVFFELGDGTIHPVRADEHDFGDMLDLSYEVWQANGEPSGHITAHETRISLWSRMTGLVLPTLLIEQLRIGSDHTLLWDFPPETPPLGQQEALHLALDAFQRDHPELAARLMPPTPGEDPAPVHHWSGLVWELLWIIPLALAIWSFPATLGYRNRRTGTPTEPHAA